MKLKPGQVLIGRQELARVLGLSERNTRTALKLLKTTGITTTETTNHFSVITLVKWVDYQGQPHKVTTETTGEVTNSRPTADQQPTTEQECNNVRMNNKDKTLPPAGGPDPERTLWIAAWHDAFLKAHGKAPDVVPGLRSMDKRRKNTTPDEWRRRIENCFGNPFTKNFTLLEFSGVKWDKCASPFEGGSRGSGFKKPAGQNEVGTCAEPERVPRSAI